jgi:hypothetical protein
MQSHKAGTSRTERLSRGDSDYGRMPDTIKKVLRGAGSWRIKNLEWGRRQPGRGQPMPGKSQRRKQPGWEGQ